MMKSEFAFIALPISALVAPPTFAVQYLTVDEAQRAILPGQIVDGRIGETGFGSTESYRADQRRARLARRTATSPMG